MNSLNLEDLNIFDRKHSEMEIIFQNEQIKIQTVNKKLDGEFQNLKFFQMIQ